MTTAPGSEPGAFLWPDAKSESLLRKYLTDEVWHALRGLQTHSGATLFDCIRSGLTHSDSAIGVYAADEESLRCFGPLFDPLIQDLHDNAAAYEQPEGKQSVVDPAILNLDPQGIYIRSSRIRIARNICGYRLMPTIHCDELMEVQQLLRATFERFENGLAGNYRGIDNPDTSGFDGTDKFQQAAGICRFWPDGRGIFTNHAGTLQIWVNEEDHLRIVSVQQDSNIQAAYRRAVHACSELERSLQFGHSSRYGYLASCPTNLGSGLRASFHIHLPLTGGSSAFENICSAYGIAVRSATGESGSQSGPVYDISNRYRMRLTPERCIHKLLTGALQLIELEKLAAR